MKNLCQLIKMVIVSEKIASEERSKTFPTVAKTSQAAEEIASKARKLSSKCNDFEHAHWQLAQFVDGRERELEMAVTICKMRNWLDLRRDYLAVRLLESVRDGTIECPLSDELAERFSVIEAFCQLSESERYDELRRRMPLLVELEGHAERLRDDLEKSRDRERSVVFEHFNRSCVELSDHISKVFGPNGGSQDIVVGSRTARDFVTGLLQREMASSVTDILANGEQK